MSMRPARRRDAVFPGAARHVRRRALATSVLVGMQPVLTQVPPKSCRSMNAVFRPSLSSRAAERGPGLSGADDDRVEALARRCGPPEYQQSIVGRHGVVLRKRHALARGQRDDRLNVAQPRSPDRDRAASRRSAHCSSEPGLAAVIERAIERLNAPPGRQERNRRPRTCARPAARTYYVRRIGAEHRIHVHSRERVIMSSSRGVGSAIDSRDAWEVRGHVARLPHEVRQRGREVGGAPPSAGARCGARGGDRRTRASGSRGFGSRLPLAGLRGVFHLVRGCVPGRSRRRGKARSRGS